MPEWRQHRTVCLLWLSSKNNLIDIGSGTQSPRSLTRVGTRIFCTLLNFCRVNRTIILSLWMLFSLTVGYSWLIKLEIQIWVFSLTFFPEQNKVVPKGVLTGTVHKSLVQDFFISRKSVITKRVQEAFQCVSDGNWECVCALLCLLWNALICHLVVLAIDFDNFLALWTLSWSSVTMWHANGECSSLLSGDTAIRIPFAQHLDLFVHCPASVVPLLVTILVANWLLACLLALDRHCNLLIPVPFQ